MNQQNQLSINSFNKHNKTTLIHNWQEEEDLNIHTGVYRSLGNSHIPKKDGIIYKEGIEENNTFDRCFGQKGLNRDMNTLSEYQSEWGKFKQGDNTQIGKREQMKMQQYMTLIQEDLRRTKKIEDDKANERCFETNYDDYQGKNLKDEQKMVVNQLGKRVMKTQNMQPIVGNVKDTYADIHAVDMI